MLSNKAKGFLDNLDIGKWAEDSLPHKLFLYGPPKAGKTALALSSGTPTLHISTEPSANVLRNKHMEPYRNLVDTLEYSGMDNLLSVVQGMYEGHDKLKKYENLVIDTQDGVNTLFLTSLPQKAKDARQDYKLLLEAWAPVIYYIGKLRANVTVISHEREKTDQNGATLGVTGNVSQGVRLETCSKLDSVGRLYEVNGQRKISFKKTATIEVGSRSDLDGKVLPVDDYWTEVRKWESNR